MKITISGSLGNIGKHLSQILIDGGHELTVISSNPEKKADIEKIGAKAAIGSVSDVTFLHSAFNGADAVFVMTPPNLGGQNIIQNTVDAGKAFTAAIKSSDVKRVVMLSSIGADIEAGTGPIAGLYHIEQLYKTLENTSVTFLRAGYFYTNYYNDIPMIKNAGIMGGNYPSNAKLPLVYAADIAVAAAQELEKTGEGQNIRYIVSDYISAEEATKAIADAVGKPDLNWVEFTDEQSLNGMKQAGIPEEIAGLYTEMGIAIRTGKLQSDFEKIGTPITGATKFVDFAKELVANF
ncbi:NAD(P)H-binding protein [Pedobacter sp. N23S346]|uniref:NmrA family NAD(P)-binding protein n=1 Tax=Pedobacter sp. N23S346 TaxID=3402750 RepID=UPI003AD732F8